MSEIVENGPLHPDAEGDYLSAAANWLALAEEEMTEESTAFEWNALVRMAKLNMAMANACGGYQWRQSLMRPNPAFFSQPAAPPIDSIPNPLADPEAQVREQVKRDVAEHDGARWRPGVDPEPPDDGELLTEDGTVFVYAVAPLRADSIDRWLIIRHYAQYLRWRDAPEPKAPCDTWEGLDGKIGYTLPLRRPTAEERQRFYGPEPDPAPAPALKLSQRVEAALADRDNRMEPDPYPGSKPDPYPGSKPDTFSYHPAHTAKDFIVCPRCARVGRELSPGERDRRTAENDPVCPKCARPPADNRVESAHARGEGGGVFIEPGKFEATVSAASDDAVEAMYQAVKRVRTRRAYTAPEDR